VLQGDDMKVMENDTDWQFVTIGDQVNPSFIVFYVRDIHRVRKKKVPLYFCL